MHIDKTVEKSIELGLVLGLGAAAYIACKHDKSASNETPQVNPAIVGFLTTLLSAISVYFFAQVPVALWELCAGVALGNLTFRRLFHRI